MSNFKKGDRVELNPECILRKNGTHNLLESCDEMIVTGKNRSLIEINNSIMTKPARIRHISEFQCLVEERYEI